MHILTHDKEFCILIKISLKFVPKVLIDNTLSEPMLTRFTDTHMRHQGQMSKTTSWWCGVVELILFNTASVNAPSPGGYILSGLQIETKIWNSTNIG